MMVLPVRARLRSEAGFTLVEILVVIVIVGILGAIAVPSFLAQRVKAQDAEAKVYLVAAQKALEAWHTTEGTYAGAGQAELARIEPALDRARNFAVNGNARTFDVSIDSAAGASGGGRFTLSRVAGDRIVRTCTNAGRGACSGTNEW
jgi:type IV pilus assembly protein PilA